MLRKFCRKFKIYNHEELFLTWNIIFNFNILNIYLRYYNIGCHIKNVCVPETRGTAFAFFNLADDLGKGAGPVLVVSLIQSCKGHRR